RRVAKNKGASDNRCPLASHPPPGVLPTLTCLQQWRDGVRASQSAAARDVADNAVRNRAERAHTSLVVGDRVCIDRIPCVQTVGGYDGIGEAVAALAAAGGLS